MRSGEIKDNYERFLESVNNVCVRIGRSADDIKVVAVSKTFPCSDIEILYELGHRDFGENKVQELRYKKDVLKSLDIKWHLIGHLQTNKVKHVIDFVSLVHSVDRKNLVDEIKKRADAVARNIKVLVQVNTSGELSKSGVNPENTREFCSQIAETQNIELCGLMTIAKLDGDKNEIRKNFSDLKTLFDSIKSNQPEMEILSMGMTSDYEIAIEEGSTMIRAGSAIFGNRNYN